MPPFTYPITFEEIEAKTWACNTVSTILTDVAPVSFEPHITNTRPSLQINIQPAPTPTKSNSSDLKRSFSFLETSLFRHYYREKQIRNSRRSQSTIITDTQSAPTTPTSIKGFPQPSISSRIRQHIDRAASIKHQLLSTADIFHSFYKQHKKSAKEQKGIALWKETYAKYSTTAQHVECVESKRSIQLFKFILNELLTTEETYLNHLLIIKHFYMDPLLEAASQNKKPSLVNLKDIEIIFAFIPQLISLSTTLVERLHDTVGTCLEDDSKKNQISIGKTFCDLEKYFDIYIYYTVNFEKSRKHLRKASSSIVYRQLVQDSISQKKTNRMLLADYMIAPIQRITRYCLLLTDLQKHSNKSHRDYVYIDKALKCLKALAFAMNAVQ